MLVIISLPFSIGSVCKYLGRSNTIEGEATQGGDFFNASDQG